MARFVLGAVTGVAAMVLGMPLAGAQLPPPVEGPVKETTKEVVDTVEETVNEASDTVKDGGGGVDETVDGTTDTVNDAVSSEVGGGGDGAGSETGPATSPLGDAAVSGGGTSRAMDGSGSGTSSPGATGEARGGAGGGAERGLNAAREASATDARLARIIAAAAAPAGVYIPLLVRLTNDGDVDGAFSDSESAPRPGADVPFQLRLENVGSTDLSVLAVRGVSSIPEGQIDAGACADLVGALFVPGQVATCRFTVEGFAPGPGDRVVPTIEIDVVDMAGSVGTVTDTTVVGTPADSVLGLVVPGEQDSLATTGARIALLLAVALALAGVGTMLTRLANRRAERVDRVQRRWTPSSPVRPSGEEQEAPGTPRSMADRFA